MFTCACMWVDVHFICIYMLCVAENACVNVHCVFTFECMGFYMCAHESVCMLCMHVYVYLGVGVCVHVCIICMYMCMYPHLYLWICPCLPVLMCAFVCMHL